MIESYRGLAVFVAVADVGSLSAAWRRLKLYTWDVSHHLSRLESRMGTPLFFRSTRSIALTAEGGAALAPARRKMAAGEEAVDALRAGSDQPVGALHVTMPAWGKRLWLRQKLWDFARRYPMVAISRLPDEETFERDGRSVPFKPENVRLKVDTISSATSAILAGLGIRHLPVG